MFFGTLTWNTLCYYLVSSSYCRSLSRSQFFIYEENHLQHKKTWAADSSLPPCNKVSGVERFYHSQKLSSQLFWKLLFFNMASINPLTFGAMLAWINKNKFKNKLSSVYVPIKRVMLYSIVIMKWPYKLLSSDLCYSIDFRSCTSFQAESAARDILGSGGNRERI